jgi:signal transduction histidine kinase
MAAGNLSARSGIERQDEFGLLANSFNQMAESIEAKVAALRRFVADAAHELHTPLTALRTNLELVDGENIPSAMEQVTRMDALTRSLLDLSQLEAIDSEIQFADVDLAALLWDLSEPYASRAEQAELSFNLDIEPDPIIIKGDGNQLGTLIQNLLDNAIKFTPAGGQVNVNLNILDEAAQLRIADTGIGIPEEAMPHLFSRFHRGRNAAAYPGSGLGLAIVKTIADQHGASIRVESDSTSTVFVLYMTPFPENQ